MSIPIVDCYWSCGVPISNYCCCTRHQSSAGHSLATYTLTVTRQKKEHMISAVQFIQRTKTKHNEAKVVLVFH
ncbi:MAG: hypothetical protein ACK51L_02490 [bacterium]